VGSYFLITVMTDCIKICKTVVILYVILLQRVMTVRVFEFINYMCHIFH